MQTETKIILQGTLTLEDLVRFQYFHSLRRAWLLLAMLSISLVALYPMFLGLFSSYPDGYEDSENGIANLVPILGFILLWVIMSAVMPYRNAKKLFAAQVNLREPSTLVFDANGISSEARTVSWNMTWDLLKSVRETKSLFLLYHGPNQAAVIPKRFFLGPQELDQWRAMVGVHIAPNKIVGSGIVGKYC